MFNRAPKKTQRREHTVEATTWVWKRRFINVQKDAQCAWREDGCAASGQSTSCNLTTLLPSAKHCPDMFRNWNSLYVAPKQPLGCRERPILQCSTMSKIHRKQTLFGALACWAN